MPKYETYAQVKKIYNVSPETIRNWAKKDQIRYKCIQNEKRKTWLFDIDSIGEYLQQSTNTIQNQDKNKGLKPTRILYIRVSSAKQKADLERQRELLSIAFPDTEIISDIGSGLDFHKPGITKLVRKICRDKVSQIVVTFKDRLARFGYELFELMCKEHGCSILVYGDGINQTKDDESELKDDLLAIVNVFVASNNGKRAAMLRKERKRLEQEEKQRTTNGDNQSEIIPNKKTEKET